MYDPDVAKMYSMTVLSVTDGIMPLRSSAQIAPTAQSREAPRPSSSRIRASRGRGGG